MYPELFTIGNFTLYTHGVLAVFGIIFGSYILFRLAKQNKLHSNFLFDNIVYSVLIGIIGARITYFCLYRDQFSSFSEIFFLWQGGMVSYGGFIPGFAVFIGLLKLQKAKINEWLAISAVAFPLGLFWGRIGNIFAGEYAGIMTKSRFNLNGYVPVVLYEAMLLVVISLSLLYTNKKMGNAVTKYMFLILIIAYTSGRFILDFWRSETDLMLGLSTGQLTSLFLLLLSLIILIHRLFFERRQHATS